MVKEEPTERVSDDFCKKIVANLAKFATTGAGDRTRTGTVSPPVDFESTTSTNSITPAKLTTVYTNLPRLARGRAGLFYLLLPPGRDIISAEISAAGIPGNWSRGNGVRRPASGSL